MSMPARPIPHEQVSEYLRSRPPETASWRQDVLALRRETRDEALAVRGSLEPVAATEVIDAGGVPARLYYPRGGEEDLLVWIHGGGWMHGDLDGYEGVARALANRAQCAVLAVDYRLAPEHPFPAGFTDAWAATFWARQNFSRVAVGGDSSGGNLAAAIALKARDAELDLRLQLLIYPVLDSTPDTAFKQRFRQQYSTFAGQAGYGPTAYARIKHIWETYVPDPALRDCPYVSPRHAATLRGVAPAAIFTAEHDILRGEAEDYLCQLMADDVAVEVHAYPGQIHGFFQMLGVMDDARNAIALAAAAIRTAFDSHDRDAAQRPGP